MAHLKIKSAGKPPREWVVVVYLEKIVAVVVMVVVVVVVVVVVGYGTAIGDPPPGDLKPQVSKEAIS